jgi:translocator protein
LCLLIGGINAAVTEPNIADWYAHLRHPAGTPPDWAFPVAWTLLYLAMAVAAWLVWRRETHGLRNRALLLWSGQLALNALWTPFVFGLHMLLAGVVVIAALLAAILATTVNFYRIDRRACLLMLPYAGWVAYACWLSFGLWWLNRPPT